MKSIRNVFIIIILGFVCSGCLLRLEHNITSPGAHGVVLDAQTHAPLSGAEVAVSPITFTTNTQPRVVTTGKKGRFSIRPQREWRLVIYLAERYLTPGGNLVVKKAGYQPAVVRLWGQEEPILIGTESTGASPTNFIEVVLSPVAK